MGWKDKLGAVREKVRNFRRSRKKYLVTLVLVLLLLALAVYSNWSAKAKSQIVYREALDTVALEVNGTELTLRDVAFYVAYEEDQVEQQALAYDAEDTGKYWNVHADGVYIRVAARNAAAQMAIHDEVFYQMALADGIELSDEEEEVMQSHLEDFWADLLDGEKDTRLGVTKEDIEATMRKIAYAEKMQTIYAELNNLSYEDYDFSGEAYEELLKEQKYKIRGNIWKRLGFGNITLEH
jgi:hypothetical protein